MGTPGRKTVFVRITSDRPHESCFPPRVPQFRSTRIGVLHGIHIPDNALVFCRNPAAWPCPAAARAGGRVRAGFRPAFLRPGPAGLAVLPDAAEDLARAAGIVGARGHVYTRRAPAIGRRPAAGAGCDRPRAFVGAAGGSRGPARVCPRADRSHGLAGQAGKALRRRAS